MHILSHSQLLQVSGGLNLSCEDLENSAKEYSYEFAFWGAVLSGAYGLLTTPLAAILTGSAIGNPSSWPTSLWIGTGVSWLVGYSVGAGVAVYNSASVE